MLDALVRVVFVVTLNLYLPAIVVTSWSDAASRHVSLTATRSHSSMISLSPGFIVCGLVLIVVQLAQCLAIVVPPNGLG